MTILSFYLKRAKIGERKMKYLLTVLMMIGLLWPTASLAEEQHDNALLREYGVGAQILRDLGIRDMILLSNTERSIVGLGGHGLVIKERRDIKFGRDYKYPVRDEFYE